MQSLTLPGGALLTLFFLTGCSVSPPPTASVASSTSAGTPADARPGLGTKFGETRDSKVRSTNFVRATPDKPLTLATVQYNDAEGARAMGWHGWRSGPVAVSDLAEAGFKDGGGKFLPLDSRRGIFSGNKYGLIGRTGERYAIWLRNDSDARLEFVVSVDGLDVIDGRAAALNKPGYMIEPGKSVLIDGFRRSMSQVAAFRFSAVKDSYAQRKYGDTTNVGVIGIAIFSEKGTNPQPRLKQEARRRNKANPFPGNSSGGFAEPPPR